MSGLDDLRRPLDVEPAFRRWVAATQRRNLASLEARQGPGGAPLAKNKKYTIKKKGHDRVGFGATLEMARGLVAADGFAMRVGGAVAEAEVYAGQNVAKVNIFLKGQPERVIVKTARYRKRGKGLRGNPTRVDPLLIREFGHEFDAVTGNLKRWKRTVPPVPARDFIGVADSDLDAAAEDFAADVLRQWGFRQEG